MKKIYFKATALLRIKPCCMNSNQSCKARKKREEKAVSIIIEFHWLELSLSALRSCSRSSTQNGICLARDIPAAIYYFFEEPYSKERARALLSVGERVQVEERETT